MRDFELIHGQNASENARAEEALSYHGQGWANFVVKQKPEQRLPSLHNPGSNVVLALGSAEIRAYMTQLARARDQARERELAGTATD